MESEIATAGSYVTCGQDISKLLPSAIIDHKFDYGCYNFLEHRI